MSLLLVFLVTIPIAIGALWMQIDFSPEQVYVGNGDAVEFCEQHKELFRFEDSLILVLLEANDGRSLLREDCLLWMKGLAEKAEKLNGVREVTSIATLRRPRIGLPGQGVTWTPLISEQLYGDTEYLQRSLKRIPLLNDTLISRDHQLMMTLIDVDPADRSIAKATEHIRDIEQLLACLLYTSDAADE